MAHANDGLAELPPSTHRRLLALLATFAGAPATHDEWHFLEVSLIDFFRLEGIPIPDLAPVHWGFLPPTPSGMHRREIPYEVRLSLTGPIEHDLIAEALPRLERVFEGGDLRLTIDRAAVVAHIETLRPGARVFLDDDLRGRRFSVDALLALCTDAERRGRIDAWFRDDPARRLVAHLLANRLRRLRPYLELARRWWTPEEREDPCAFVLEGWRGRARWPNHRKADMAHVADEGAQIAALHRRFHGWLSEGRPADGATLTFDGDPDRGGSPIRPMSDAEARRSAERAERRRLLTVRRRSERILRARRSRRRRRRLAD